MEIQQIQYEKIVGEIEDVQRMRHDLRYHYKSLNDMLEKGQLGEIKEYLSRMIDTTVRREKRGLLQEHGSKRIAAILCRAGQR